MHRFAARWRRQQRGKWLKTAKLSSFCVLIKRRVIEAVEGLDERPGFDAFDDLAARARRAGFDLAVALDLFVHCEQSRPAPTVDGKVTALGRRCRVSLTMIVRNEEEEPAPRVPCLGGRAVR